jgi:hypothetical protein
MSRALMLAAKATVPAVMRQTAEWVEWSAAPGIPEDRSFVYRVRPAAPPGP